MVKGKLQIAILGAGREGQSLARFLRRRFGSRADLTILDRNPAIKKHHSHILKNMRMITGPNYLKNLEQFDIIFRSPGIPYLTPEIQKAKKAGVVISSATKLFFEEITNYKVQSTKTKPILIGVTGTKGKGTTCTLLYQMLKAAGKKVVLAGNIGKPMLDVLEQAKRADYVILELSSFQLQDMNVSPDIAVLLSITPDHLDHHKSHAEYVWAKMRIAMYQKPNDAVFYLSNSKIPKVIARQSEGKKFSVNTEDMKGIIAPEELLIPGFHNFENATLAAKIAQHLKVSISIIRRVVKNFRGRPLRLELIRTIRNKRHGTWEKAIHFYNDSASTNPTTAIAAIKAFKDPIVWIAGGRSAGYHYSPLVSALKKASVREAVLFGENKYEIEKIISGAVSVAIANDLKSAVREAYDTAKTMLTETGNVRIVFSPASKSFDMFKDYEDRGEQFNTIIKNLKL